MIITYTRGRADFERLGKNWIAYRWHKYSDTLILHNLWKVISDNLDKDFEEICEIAKSSYKNRTVKSRVDVHREKDSLEITRKGIFPNILIKKS